MFYIATLSLSSWVECKTVYELSQGWNNVNKYQRKRVKYRSLQPFSIKTERKDC